MVNVNLPFVVANESKDINFFFLFKWNENRPLRSIIIVILVKHSFALE